MDIILKQRLIGAIVLVSLGVIFIPMLLTGEDGQTPSNLSSRIQQPPEYNIKKPTSVTMRTVTVPVMLPTEQTLLEKIPDVETGSDAQRKTADEVETSGALNSGPEVVAPAALKSEPREAEEVTSDLKANPETQSTPQANTPEKQTVKPVVVAEKKALQQKAESKKTVPKKNELKKAVPKIVESKNIESKNTELKKTITSVVAQKNTTSNIKPVEVTKPEQLKPGTITSWVVQVGSFKQEENAIKLRDKLRKKGYAGFVEPRTETGETHYRVRVGPELKNSLAETLLQKLQKDEKLAGIVMSYPPR